MPTKSNQFILAIDLGTSGPKVALVSTGGEIAAHEIETTRLIFLPNGGVEQSPDEWWQAIKKATRRLLKKSTAPAKDIVAVCCASQYSSTTAVSKNGRPLMNAIGWMDTRGAGYVRQVTGGTVKIQGYGVAKLLTWLRLTGGIPTHSGNVQAPA